MYNRFDIWFEVISKRVSADLSQNTGNTQNTQNTETSIFGNAFWVCETSWKEFSRFSDMKNTNPQTPNTGQNRLKFEDLRGNGKFYS